MKLYDWKDLYSEAQALHEKGNLIEAEKRYNAILNRQIANSGLLYLLGSLNMQKGNNGLAIILLEKCLEDMGQFPEAWNNLGISYKKEFFKEQAAACFQKAWEINPDCADYPSNCAGCYINEGEPEVAIELCNKALEIDPEHQQSKWHKSLALMELQQWKEGFALYEARFAGVFQGTGSDIPNMRNYAKKGMTPWWDGKAKGLVAIHGEQGIGDEVLFATCFAAALESGAELVFECTPRMEGLFNRSIDCKVIGTNRLDGSEWKGDRTVDYKLGVGSFGNLYRSEGNIPGTPYLIPDPKLKKYYAKRLKSLGARPKIGIAWQGGVPSTRVDLRTIRLNEFQSIIEQEADFISLQYTQPAKEEVMAFKAETGLRIIHWKDAAEAKDMDHYAALVCNLDLVISVCQTAIHICGALGVQCLCLTPYAPAWRYGVTGDFPWYQSVDLIRQQKGDTWEPAINYAAQKLAACLKTGDFSKVITGKSIIAGQVPLVAVAQ